MMYKMQLTLVTGPLVPHEIHSHGYKIESESTYICMDNTRISEQTRTASADPEGGPGVRTPPPPPPWDLSEVGVLCRGLMGRRGGPTVVLPYYSLFFRLASLASIIQTYYLYIRTPISIFSMERSPFLYISLIQIMTRIQLPIPCF